MSIHPRCEFPNGKKLNTCQPRSRQRVVRMIEGIERHIANHPNDAAAKQRLANAQNRLRGMR